MRIKQAKTFKKQLSALSPEIQRLAQKQITRMQKDWKDPRLQLKRLKGEGAWSFRITRRYRAICAIEEGVIYLAAIGHRKDIYR